MDPLPSFRAISSLTLRRNSPCLYPRQFLLKKPHRCISTSDPSLPDFSFLQQPPIFLRIPNNSLRRQDMQWQLWQILQRGLDGTVGSLPISKEEMGHESGGWRLIDNGRVLERTWTFKRFRDAASFTQAVAIISKGELHPPPVILHADKFVLIRLTNRSEEAADPASTSHSPLPTTTQEPPNPSEFPAATSSSEIVGLTHTTIRFAAQIAARALIFYPNGIGEEHPAWHFSSGPAETAATARRLLALGLEETLREKTLARREHRALRVDRSPAERRSEAEEKEKLERGPMNPEGEANREKATRSSFEAVASASQNRGNAGESSNADAIDPHGANADEDISPTEKAARAALLAGGDDLIGINWVGLANLEQQRRARRAFQERKGIAKEKEKGDKVVTVRLG